MSPQTIKNMHFPDEKATFSKKARDAVTIPRFAVALLSLLLLNGCALGDSYANFSKWIGLDIVKMIGRSDPVGHLCLILLLLFSISTWAIIIYKFLHIRTASKQTDHFVDGCMSGSGGLEDAYSSASAFPDSPLAQILREGYLELEIEDWYKVGYDLTSEQRVEVAKAGVERVFERTITNEVSHLESNLIFLAVASNVCPFIGLFGTVWGIMSTFQAMSTQHTGGLEELFPGIATALTTTVAGLAAAIPASVMYNYFTARVQVLISRMDSFALELSNIIQKQLLKQRI